MTASDVTKLHASLSLLSSSKFLHVYGFGWRRSKNTRETIRKIQWRQRAEMADVVVERVLTQSADLITSFRRKRNLHKKVNPREAARSSLSHVTCKEEDHAMAQGRAFQAAKQHQTLALCSMALSSMAPDSIAKARAPCGRRFWRT